MVNRLYPPASPQAQQSNGLVSDTATTFLTQVYGSDNIAATKALTQQCDKHVIFESIAISLRGIGNVMRLLLLIPAFFDKVTYSISDVADTIASSKGQHVVTVDGHVSVRLRVPWILRRLSWFNSMLWLLTGQQHLRLMHKLHYNSQGYITKIEQVITVRDLLEAIPAVSFAFRALVTVISTLWTSPVTSVGVGWLQNFLSSNTVPHTS